jgi:ubiquinone/menaquinone biosynthesis C-methylase UbiE
MITSKLFDKQDYQKTEYASIKAYFESWWQILMQEGVTFSYSDLNRAWEYAQIFNSVGFVGQNVLDLGTCKSLAPIYMVRRLMCKVTTFDIAFVDLREILYKAAGIRDSVRIDVGDLHEPLPYPNDSFDIITAFSTIEHVKNTDMMIREMKRVCRPEGFICLTTDYADWPTEGVKSGICYGYNDIAHLMTEIGLPIEGQADFRNVDATQPANRAVNGDYTFLSLVFRNVR